MDDEARVSEVRVQLAVLGDFLAKCRKRLLTAQELDHGLSEWKRNVGALLEPGTPASRTFDREMRELPTEYRKASTSPYVVDDDCKRVESRIRVLGKVLVELAPAMDAIDDDEIQQLPLASRHDLEKAKARLRDGDLSGAIGSACAAVDAATMEVFKRNNLGDPTDASFQERVTRCLRASGTIPTLERDLSTIGWPPEDAKRLRENLVGSMNQAAYVMQTLRSKMGDAHGTQAVLEPLVYDSLKWAALIVRLLKQA